MLPEDSLYRSAPVIVHLLHLVVKLQELVISIHQVHPELLGTVTVGYDGSHVLELVNTRRPLYLNHLRKSVS